MQLLTDCIEKAAKDCELCDPPVRAELANVDQKDKPSAIQHEITTSDTKKITCVLMGKGINQQEQVRAALDKYLKAGGIIETDNV